MISRSQSTKSEDSIFSHHSNVTNQTLSTSLSSRSPSVSISESELGSHSRSESITLPHYSKLNEKLPNYSPSVEFFGFAIIKLEFLTPYKINNDKSWEPMLLEVNSTQLIFYKLDLPSNFKNLLISLFKINNKVNNEIIDNNSIKEKIDNYKNLKNLKSLKKYYDLIKENKLLFEPINNRLEFNNVVNNFNGSIHHIYTLNNCKLGIAPSITNKADFFTNIKYNNTLRLRIELNQIIIQYWSFNSMVNWYWYLNVGKGLCGEFDIMPKPIRVPKNLHRLIKDGALEENSVIDTNIIIDEMKFFIKKDNGEKYKINSLPKLNSFDKWGQATVSNFQFDENRQHIFINYCKLNHQANTRGGNCRDFVIEQEGIVSLKI